MKCLFSGTVSFRWQTCHWSPWGVQSEAVFDCRSLFSSLCQMILQSFNSKPFPHYRQLFVVLLSLFFQCLNFFLKHCYFFPVILFFFLLDQSPLLLHVPSRSAAPAPVPAPSLWTSVSCRRWCCVEGRSPHCRPWTAQLWTDGWRWRSLLAAFVYRADLVQLSFSFHLEEVFFKLFQNSLNHYSPIFV